jgi:hypothetical protein
MGHVAGTTFGSGTQATFPIPAISWGLPPYAGQALGGQLSPQHPYFQPFSNQAISGSGIGNVQLLPQILQLLQTVPQQLQQLQALQQHQILQLQQLLQLVPAHLQQLQQLIQFVPQQLQYLQQQPFGAGMSGPVGFGITPQGFAGQGASYVM